MSPSRRFALKLFVKLGIKEALHKFMALFVDKEVVGTSGSRLAYKIECDALFGEDWRTLAKIAVSQLPFKFGKVEGVPSGGLSFARALEPYCCPDSSTLLLVDDVLTTGTSLERHRGDREAKGLVAFDRGVNGARKEWIYAIWELGM